MLDGLVLERVGLEAAVALPLVGAAVARLARGGRGHAACSWAGAAAAVVATALVVIRGPARFSVLGAQAVADPLTALLLVLVTGVGALVQSYSTRYLQADPTAHRFSGRVGLVVAAMGVVAVSGDLAGLLVGWVAASMGFVGVLGSRRDLPGVAGAVRATRRALGVGDACLLLAAGIVISHVGDVRLGTPGVLAAAAARLGPWHAVVAVLVVTAALSRCAQGPFRWLPGTVSAPTPACALLHAGVVNGGGVLLVRLGALGAWRPAMAILLVVAGGPAVRASLIARHQPDVKGQLASSTVAQMGFMLAECAVGAYPAAVVHLVGHGCYKAFLFLDSGSVPRPGRPALGAATRRWAPTGVAVAAAAGAAALPGVIAGDGAVLGVFAALTAAGLATAFATALGPGRGGWRWAAALVVGAGAYGQAVAALDRFLGPALPAAAGTVGALWLAAIGAAAVVAARLAPAVAGRLLDAGAAPAGWALVPAAARRPTESAGIPAGWVADEAAA